MQDPSAKLIAHFFRHMGQKLSDSKKIMGPSQSANDNLTSRRNTLSMIFKNISSSFIMYYFLFDCILFPIILYISLSFYYYYQYKIFLRIFRLLASEGSSTNAPTPHASNIAVRNERLAIVKRVQAGTLSPEKALQLLSVAPQRKGGDKDRGQHGVGVSINGTAQNDSAGRAETCYRDEKIEREAKEKKGDENHVVLSSSMPPADNAGRRLGGSQGSIEVPASRSASNVCNDDCFVSDYLLIS